MQDCPKLNSHSHWHRTVNTFNIQLNLTTLGWSLTSIRVVCVGGLTVRGIYKNKNEDGSNLNQVPKQCRMKTVKAFVENVDLGNLRKPIESIK